MTNLLPKPVQFTNCTRKRKLQPALCGFFPGLTPKYVYNIGIISIFDKQNTPHGNRTKNKKA